MSITNFFKTKKHIQKYLQNSIIMFSEGNIYYTTNQPIINELIKEVDVLYITIDKDDDLLTYNHTNFHPVYLDFDFWGQFLMATIQCKLIITTTPGLGILSLKKSKSVTHYSYYMHAPVDIHYYQKNSFDYYDSIVCISEFQKESLNLIEKKRNTPIKQKEVLGLSYSDYYINELKKYNKQDKTVLIAPSWGDNNFINYIDYDIFAAILDAGFNIIYRPHPMSFKYENEKVTKIINTYINDNRFTLDREKNGLKSMQESTVLVSAISGIIIDYLLFCSPNVLLIDIPNHHENNLEVTDLNTTAWENNLFNNMCIKVNSQNALIEALNNSIHKDNNIQSCKDQIVNLGNASSKIASFYIELYKTI